MLDDTSMARIARNVESLQQVILCADRVREHLHDEEASNLIEACLAYDDARNQVVISDLVARETGKRHAWVQTFSGRQFYPTSPRPENIVFKDIAHSLSNVCRFNGHSRTFYSVAQHSVHVSSLLMERDLKLWGLFHDAAEAYLSDIPKPTKALLPQFTAMEDRVLKAVAVRFDLPWPIPDEVEQADLIALATEKRDLMGVSPALWNLNVEPDPKQIEPFGPATAKLIFIRAYMELGGRI